MALELVKSVQKVAETTVKEKNTEDIEVEAHIPETTFKCEKCEFTCNKIIT